MASALNSESRRLYSWWWDSHITPKNSKWLQENLTDIDSKVKSMIKLIEEDADSFARRAEMYYRKRPELMKLVEEFYRAYRALAERYDYATAELRHAQKALQAAFPDQETFSLPEDSSSFSTDPDDKENGFFGLQMFLEGNSDGEIERLKKTVADLIAEKDSVFNQYQCSLEKLSNLEEQLNNALEKSNIFEEKVEKVEREAETLKKTLGLLQSEKENGLNKQMEYLEMISDLENNIAVIDNEARLFSDEASRAKTEVEKLKNDVFQVTEEKEALRVLYSECLEKCYSLELDLSSAQSDVKRLTAEILSGGKKLQKVEEICDRLELSNRCLKTEASDLASKILLKDRELAEKQDELEKLTVYAKNEHTRYVQVEAALGTLKMLYTRSQEEQRNLANELKNGLQSVKDLQILKSGLEEELKQVKDDNTELGSAYELLHEEKSAAILEKTVLLSQIDTILVNIQKLIDQNGTFENELCTANSEIENLREKSKGLEDLCQLLNTEKANLVAERSMLASQLENVEKRLAILERRFTQFEEKYRVLENEKETGKTQILELLSALSVEKQERERIMSMNEKRLIDLVENEIVKREEFQEELDKAVIAQFENFMLQKFVKEVEEKNYELMAANEKHASASKLADKLISELETEILEQQVEEELLLVEIENLRLGIYQIFVSLEIGFETGKISIEDIISKINDLKVLSSKEEDEKQRLLIENTVIMTLLHETLKKKNLELTENYRNLGLELEEQKNREESLTLSLTSELQERENSFELWESEATSFTFDLQISNTREILFESKVQELAGVCESLEGETRSKDLVIKEMKDKESVMENEIQRLKAELLAYRPVIGSLKGNISSLERNVSAMVNIGLPNSQKSEV